MPKTAVTRVGGGRIVKIAETEASSCGRIVMRQRGWEINSKVRPCSYPGLRCEWCRHRWYDWAVSPRKLSIPRASTRRASSSRRPENTHSDLVHIGLITLNRSSSGGIIVFYFFSSGTSLFAEHSGARARIYKYTSARAKVCKHIFSV